MRVMKDLIRGLITSVVQRQRGWIGSLAGRWRKLVFVFSWFIGILVLTSFVGMEVTSKPQFCGSCHIMEPYYNSWKASSHKNVACVECHIPPGVTSELRKKYEALSMVTSYFTGTYGTNPWTEVDDASCLRCHERRLLAGKEVFHNVLFNHTPHLTEMRRGKKLRCTSCHSQIVQGSHITVTESNCFLCHFKGQELNQGTGRCTLCHEVPDKIITKANLSFDHGDVKRFNMQCFSCHSEVNQGQGEVPQQRCLTCHNDQARLGRYGETEFLHQKHITDHKVECLNCHMEIQHKTTRALEAVSTSCNTCHRDGHSAARDVYAGIGGKGIAPMPSPMYQAGIHCEACHVLPQIKSSDQAMKPNEVSCMSCHGPRYNKILGRWKALVGERLSALKSEWNQARQQTGQQQHEQGPLADAWANIELVEKGGGTHNVEYSLALMNVSHDMIREAMQQSGFTPMAKRWSEPPFESSCFRCHRGIEIQTGSFSGMNFLHKPHLNSGFECATCHRPHEEKPAKEVVRFGREGCANCHHAREQQTPSSCLRCHSDLLGRKVRYRTKMFDHSFHFKDLSQKCSDCHLSGGTISRAPTLKTCATCHPEGIK